MRDPVSGQFPVPPESIPRTLSPDETDAAFLKWGAAARTGSLRLVQAFLWPFCYVKSNENTKQSELRKRADLRIAVGYTLFQSNTFIGKVVNMSQVYGHARVSTDGQDAERQVSEILTYCQKAKPWGSGDCEGNGIQTLCGDF